jgi:hypothetical protein
MKVIRYFNHSAAALLLALATAMFIANWASTGLVQPREPVFLISMRTIFWLLGAIEICLALFCLYGQRVWWQAALIAWFAMNLVVYQAGFFWTGEQRKFDVYLDRLAQAFALTSHDAYLILGTVVLYLLGGSLLVLLLLRSEDWVERTYSRISGRLKMSCPACGVHIKFAIKNLGQKVSCPQCQASITLRKPDLLKTACYFCKGHIEFPAHSIGEKLKCPHCKMDITLMEPA